MIQIFLYTMLMTLGLYTTGYGITQFLLPKSLRNYFWWITPWIGLAVIACLGVILSLSTIPMNDASYAIIIFSILVGIFSKQTIPSFKKNDVLLALIVITTFCISSFSLLYKIQFPTVMSFGNLDPVSYSTVSDFFTQQTIHDGKIYQPFSPTSWSVGDLVHNSYRWGSPIVLSFFTVLLNTQSFAIFSLLINLLFALSVPLVFVLTKELFPSLKSISLFILVSTYAINTTLLYMLFNVFFAQFMFSGLFILSCIFFVRLTHSHQFTKQVFTFTRFEFLLAIVISAITSIYPEALSFTLLPFLGWVFFQIMITKKTKYILKLKAIFLSAILNPITFYTAIRQFIRVAISSSQVTWIGWEPIRYTSLMEILGLYNLHYSKSMPFVLLIISTIGILLLLFIGFSQIRSKLYIFSIFLFFFFSYFTTRFISHNFFTYHRAITYSIFLYTSLFMVGLSVFIRYFHSKIFTTVVVIILLFLAGRSSYRTLSQFYWHSRVVDKALISLTELNHSEILEPFVTDDVIIISTDVWKRLWREYFLQNKKVISIQNYSTDIEYIPAIKQVLIEKNHPGDLKETIVWNEIIWENEFYTLGKTDHIPFSSSLEY